MASVRRAASPYARRLAREADVGLELITGSGPDGRIVAADVAGFLAARTTQPSPSAGQAGAAVAAFSTTIGLETLRQLLADLASSDTKVSFEALLLRAAALGLEAMSTAAGQGAVPPVALEAGDSAASPPVVLADAHIGLVSRLTARLASGGDGAGGAPPQLTLRYIAQEGIRPMAMPLVGAAPLRLVLTGGGEALSAEALLSFDPARVAEAAAATLLARFRDALAQPLRLLA